MSGPEKRVLAHLAKSLGQSQSGMIRIAVSETYERRAARGEVPVLQHLAADDAPGEVVAAPPARTQLLRIP